MEGLLNVLKLINKSYDLDFEYLDVFIFWVVWDYSESKQDLTFDNQGLPHIKSAVKSCGSD
ncbi:MAG: hypothetical protein IPJ13_15745 [Saprospiraceae bacterium]|nr:hypothetical protein [Saprospiraceae bacterium]